MIKKQRERERERVTTMELNLIDKCVFCKMDEKKSIYLTQSHQAFSGCSLPR